MVRSKGMVALSNYECKLINELYPAPKWKKTAGVSKTNHATKGKRVEVLWTNYDPRELNEPESGVNQALKEAFLALRKASEAVD